MTWIMTADGWYQMKPQAIQPLTKTVICEPDYKGSDMYWSNAYQNFVRDIPVQDPAQRKLTKFAANMINASNALGAGRCPTCHGEIGAFRDELSVKEFGISGMCQNCQDSVFGAINA